MPPQSRAGQKLKRNKPQNTTKLVIEHPKNSLYVAITIQR